MMNRREAMIGVGAAAVASAVPSLSASPHEPQQALAASIVYRDGGHNGMRVRQVGVKHRFSTTCGQHRLVSTYLTCEDSDWINEWQFQSYRNDLHINTMWLTDEGVRARGGWATVGGRIFNILEKQVLNNVYGPVFLTGI